MKADLPIQFGRVARHHNQYTYVLPFGDGRRAFAARTSEYVSRGSYVFYRLGHPVRGVAYLDVVESHRPGTFLNTLPELSDGIDGLVEDLLVLADSLDGYPETSNVQGRTYAFQKAFRNDMSTLADQLMFSHTTGDACHVLRTLARYGPILKELSCFFTDYGQLVEQLCIVGNRALLLKRALAECSHSKPYKRPVVSVHDGAVV